MTLSPSIIYFPISWLLLGLSSCSPFCKPTLHPFSGSPARLSPTYFGDSVWTSSPSCPKSLPRPPAPETGLECFLGTLCYIPCSDHLVLSTQGMLSAWLDSVPTQDCDILRQGMSGCPLCLSPMTTTYLIYRRCSGIQRARIKTRSQHNNCDYTNETQE